MGESKTPHDILTHQIAEAVERLSAFEPAVDYAKLFATQIQPVLDRLPDPATAFQCAVGSQMDPLQQTLDRASQAAQTLWEQMAQTIADTQAKYETLWQSLSLTIAEAMKRTADALERVELLAALGWTVPIEMSLPDFHGFILLDGLTSERADTFFLEYYDSDGGAEFLRLETRLISAPQLAFWNPLLEQSISAFQRGDYAICVPALLLIIEGVFAVPWSVNFPNEKARKRFFDTKIAATKSSIRQYTWKSVASFVENIFESGVTSKKNHPVPKRNLILHGKSKPATWNRADCLRLFQALSTMLWLGRELAVENTGN